MEDKSWKKFSKWLLKEIQLGNARIKDKRKGRSAGGMVTGIRKTLEIKNMRKEILSTQK